MSDRGAALEYVGTASVRPLVLVGPPDALRGEFHLRNRGETRLVVRDLRLRCAPPAKTTRRAKGAKKGAGAAKAAESVPPAAAPLLEQSLRRVVVRPGQARRVPVRITLDRATPPGVYAARLEVGEDSHAVELHVTEVVDLELSPVELVIEAAPGAKVTKRVVMTNGGNVELEIPAVGAVLLEDELLHCRTHRATLADVGDEIEGLDDYIAALGRHYKAAFDPAASLRVQNPAFKLAPGETRSVDFAIQLPSKLQARTRYVAQIPFHDATLGVTVVPVA